jgi:hypothetical protein
MSFLSAIPLIGKLVDGVFNIADQAIEDKDKLNELKAKVSEIQETARESIYLAELGTKTIPWIDGLHKMGRQIINLVTIISVVVLLLLEIEITGPAAIVLGGGNAIYQFVKGKGHQPK